MRVSWAEQNSTWTEYVQRKPNAILKIEKRSAPKRDPKTINYGFYKFYTCILFYCTFKSFCSLANIFCVCTTVNLERAAAVAVHRLLLGRWERVLLLLLLLGRVGQISRSKFGRLSVVSCESCVPFTNQRTATDCIWVHVNVTVTVNECEL